MLRNRLISKKSSLTVLSCVAAVVLLASCSSSGESGGGTVIGTETAGSATGGTGVGTGTATSGTGTVTSGTGTVTSGTGTVTSGTGTVTSGTGTVTSGTATSGTATSGTATSGTATSGTATSGTATSGTNPVDGGQLVGFYQMVQLDLTDDTEPPVAAPPGFAYLDIGLLDGGNLSFILTFADLDLNCSEVVVATPIAPSGGNTFADPAGDTLTITQSGNQITVVIATLSMTFTPVSGLTFGDLQLCDF